MQLVTVNNPDKIIFVGEALVGNEAVDQLTKFDRSLKDFSGAGVGGAQRKRGIDGIILTKFDTIVSSTFLLPAPLTWTNSCYSSASSFIPPFVFPSRLTSLPPFSSLSFPSPS